MITLTACTPVQLPTPAPPATPVAPTQVDVTGPPTVVLPLPGQHVTRLVLDEQFVYWVGMPDERFLYRTPLPTEEQLAAPAVVAESRYPAGVLSQLPLVLDGDWLTFFDSATAGFSDQWALRRVNLVTSEENTVAESTADKLLYSFAASEQRVAWFMLEHNSNRACQDEGVLVAADWATGQQTKLNRTCFQTGPSWRPLAFRDNGLLADLLSKGEDDTTIGSIVRFDLTVGQPLTYTVISQLPDAHQVNLFPTLIGDWVIWNHGDATFGEPMLLNLRTAQTATLPIAANTAPCQYLQVTQHWVTGYDCTNPKRLLLYDPAQQQVVRLQTNADLSGAVVASTGNVVAVARAVEPDTTRLDSVIEWYELK